MRKILIYLSTVLLIILCRLEFPSGITSLPSEELAVSFLVGAILPEKILLAVVYLKMSLLRFHFLRLLCWLQTCRLFFLSVLPIGCPIISGLQGCCQEVSFPTCKMSPPALDITVLFSMTVLKIFSLPLL